MPAPKPERDIFGPPYLTIPSALLVKLEEAVIEAARSKDEGPRMFALGRARGLLEAHFRAAHQYEKAKGE